jgi:radical SAM protein with 4Fe4S-binding SPASM domain
MECPHIPELNYGEFSKRLHDKVAAWRIPITGSIDVTARCDLRCAHCYINLPPGDRQARERELAYRELCGILDQIVAQGCLWLLFTGGEPFLRPDFLDIYAYAKRKGLLLTLFTNGTNLSPHIADHLAEWRPFAIEITLYGRTEETYERVTGMPGSYARCMRGIELLLERKLPLKLKSMVMTLNRHEVWDMKAYAEGLGLDFRFDPVLNLRLDRDRKPAQLRIPADEVVALDVADEKRLKGWREFCGKFWGPPTETEYLYNCGAGVNTFHIDPYGQLSACIMARVPAYDLRRGSFREGWDYLMPRVRMQKRTRIAPCQHCDLLSLCGQCPGWAQMESGDPEEPVLYLCDIAHLRAEGFGLNRTKRTGVSHEQQGQGKENQQEALSQAAAGGGATDA